MWGMQILQEQYLSMLTVAVVAQHHGKAVAGKLRALVGIKDLWYSIIIDSGV